MKADPEQINPWEIAAESDSQPSKRAAPDDPVWKLIDLYMKENNPAQLQIRSYNHFIREVFKVIKQDGKATVPFRPQFFPGKPINSYGEECEFEFTDLGTSPCTHLEDDRTSLKLTPMMCRQRNLSY